MAESTLSYTYSDLRNEVCRYMSWGEDYTTVASDIQSRINRIIREGYAQFLAPQVREDGSIHEWSFLKPWVTVTTSAPYSTGTVAIAAGVVTLTGGTFPAWVADGEIAVDGSTYTIASRDSGTQVTLDDTSVTVTGSNEYVLSQSTYTMDDNFAGIEGTITYAANTGKEPIRVINLGQLNEMKSIQSINVSWPCYAAVTVVDTAGTSTEGQRFVLVFYPSPDAAYTLTYRKVVAVGNLDATSQPYPLGGMYHSNTILASCFAIAERYGETPATKSRQHYAERLKASLAIDSQHNATEYYGYNGDTSDRRGRDVFERVTRATYAGTYYP